MFDDVVTAVFEKNFEKLNAFATSNDINTVDEDGQTLLMYAVMDDDADLELVQHLLKLGSHVNAIDDDGRTALTYAILDNGENPSITHLLLHAGAEVNIADKDHGCTPLHFACREQYMEIAEALIHAGALVDSKESFGNTPLALAVGKNTNLNLIRMLLQRGANPDTPNNSGISPRDRARRIGHSGILSIFEEFVA